MKFIIGKKIEMTQVFREDGAVVPVTKIVAGPCIISQVKTKEKDNNDSVQLGFGSQKIFRFNQAQKGHLKDIHLSEDKNNSVRFLREFKNNNDLKKGDIFGAEIFSVGEKVQVTGMSKGKGFQGVVKRHGFSGSLATHGHKDQLRMPGSIGATGPQRVFKGMRMGGHMGDAQVTVKNLEVVKIDLNNNEIYLKGAVPGARNSLLYIFTDEGKIDPRKDNKKTETVNNVENSVEENVNETK
ncbi:MAG: 50S ribosomal protein L3 [Patescibacteria group bacterium]